MYIYIYIYIYHRLPPMRPPTIMSTSTNGVRKLWSETATGLSQQEYLHSGYSRDEVTWAWGGQSLGEGWHFVQDFLIIPGSVTPLIPRALKGPRGRCYTTRGNLSPGVALAPGPRRIHEYHKCPDVSGTPGNWAQWWEDLPRSPFETSLWALHELLLRGWCPLERPSCPLSHGISHT